MINKIQIRKVVLIFFMSLSFSMFSRANVHPIKISTCVITQSNNEISVKLYFFADDFGTHLKKIYGNSVDLNSTVSIQNILDYISKHYILKINNKITLLENTKIILNDNVFQVNFKVKLPIKYLEGKTNINITNTLLFGAFKNQTNIVRIDLKGDGNYTTLEFNKKNKHRNVLL